MKPDKQHLVVVERRWKPLEDVHCNLSWSLKSAIFSRVISVSPAAPDLLRLSRFSGAAWPAGGVRRGCAFAPEPRTPTWAEVGELFSGRRPRGPPLPSHSVQTLASAGGISSGPARRPAGQLLGIGEPSRGFLPPPKAALRWGWLSLGLALRSPRGRAPGIVGPRCTPPGTGERRGHATHRLRDGTFPAVECLRGMNENFLKNNFFSCTYLAFGVTLGVSKDRNWWAWWRRTLKLVRRVISCCPHRYGQRAEERCKCYRGLSGTQERSW
ncbi:uncharacterized protein LOC118017133 [Mirounga leonina]|uniref:uncharacterized protein LOC118017133 n=1 Tax=Mirounga leonina TaxID=9715 RepID=UPI00156C5710|nr:uncharacterized protein LOC118017133 [Mirounga leonina]XP_054366778.1 uncharacterized protein LOC129046237 [Mirounga angustirostris]